MSNSNMKYRIFNSYKGQTGNPIRDAVIKLITIKEGAKILENNNDHLSDSLRYIIVFGIHSGFSSCFEIVEHTDKKTPEGKAFIIWSELFSDDCDNLYKLYKVFRNLMEHQGYYIGPSTMVMENDPLLDIDHPVRKYPHFVEVVVNGEVVTKYSLQEWVEIVYLNMYNSLCRMEKIRRFIIHGEHEEFSEMSSIIEKKFTYFKKAKKITSR